jgi:hypothetical protein
MCCAGFIPGKAHRAFLLISHVEKAAGQLSIAQWMVGFPTFLVV